MARDLIRAISQEGLRVFNTQNLKKVAISIGLKGSYVHRMTALMVRNGDIISLGNGLYTLPVELLAGGPLHSFEIAMKLAKKGAISHRSAMVYHELTDQMVSKMYVTVPREEGANLSSLKYYQIQGIEYELIRIAPEHYWGIKTVFLGEARVWITDLERTLIDGLVRPDLCGGFREVMFAFEKGTSRISPDAIFNYARRTSLAVCKRLGWVLERVNLYPELQKEIEDFPMSYYQRLDAAGARKGKVISRWNLLENI